MTDLVVRKMAFPFDSTVPLHRRCGPPPVFHAVPTAQLVRMLWKLALSQTPHHDPADQPLPDWADTWMREYDRGTDMTTFVGKG